MTRIIAILILLATSLDAANWYVDPDAAGANNGTSWSDAWTDPDNINWGTSSSGVEEGDTIYFSDGTYSGSVANFTIGDSGTSGNPIILSVSTDPGHDGWVVFDFANVTSAGANGIAHGSRTHITYNGENNGQSRWLLANFVNITRSGARENGNAIRGNNIEGVTVKWLTVSNVSTGLDFTSALTDNAVHNNSFINIRGDAAVTLVTQGSPTWDQNLIYSNSIHRLKNSQVPPGESGSWGGPDGVQINSGTSVYNNTFDIEQAPSGTYTSTQHPDNVQSTGNYTKIYNNDFKNLGDSHLDFDWQGKTSRSDIWVYNNVLRQVGDVLTSTPQYVRLYSSGSSTTFTQLDNFKFWNNTIIDSTAYIAFRTTFNNSTVSGTGNEFRNNIFVNCATGNTGAPTVRITAEAWTWTLSNNLYYDDTLPDLYIEWQGTDYTAVQWVDSAGVESNGTYAEPLFEFYATNSASNDLRLDEADTAARGNGLSLASSFTTDKDGNTRSAWDIGAYEYTSGGADVTPPVISGVSVDVTGATTATVTFTTDEPATSAVEWDTSSGAPYGNSVTNNTLQTSHSINLTGLSSATVHYYRVTATDADSNNTAGSEDTFDTTSESPVLGVDTTTLSWVQATNTTAQLSVTITNTGGGSLSWSASVGGSPFSISGTSSGSLSADQTATISVDYDPTTKGHDQDFLTITGGGNASIALSGLAYEVQPLSGLMADAATFENMATRFELTDGYIYQLEQELDPDISARAIFGFEITSAGDYIIKSIVNAADGGRNSFYLEDNEAPTSPDDIWDVVNFTTGFEERSVSIRGSGTFDAPEFFPATFTLSTGLHHIDFRGREQEVYLSNFVVEAASPPPPAGASRRVNPRSGIRVGF